MARKRSPEHDYICAACGCPTTPPGPDAKHIGGGQGMRPCGRTPNVWLRSAWEAELDASAKAAVAAIRGRLG